MENLPPEQKSQMRSRVQEMEQMMNRLEDQYQDMETAMGGWKLRQKPGSIS
jgi:hypothetical protein